MKYGLRVLTFSIAVLFLIGLQSACESHKKKSLQIAISSENTANNYGGWLKRHSSDIRVYNLYPMGVDSALKVLGNCDGLLLTGGPDVFPKYYNQIEDSVGCGPINHYRDSLEFALAAFALKQHMPIFGVCRGQQLLNVALGGSLIIDIPTDYDTTVKHRILDWRNCYHKVNPVHNTLLFRIGTGKIDDVTSNHHQAIDRLADPLRISAYADDSIPEAIEWFDRSNKGFLMAVQWHPERMDSLHPYSAPLANEFLKEVGLFADSRDK